MSTSLFVLFLAFGALTPATSQVCNFFVSFGEPNNDRPAGLQIDASGIYASGFSYVDSVTVKFDFTGTIDFAVKHYLSGKNDYAKSSTQNADSIFVGGSTFTTPPYMFVSRIAKSDGSEVWTKQYPVSGTGFDIVLVDSSYVYHVFFDFTNQILYFVKLNLVDGSEVYQVKYSISSVTSLFGQIYGGYLYITFVDATKLNVWKVDPVDASLVWGKTEVYSPSASNILVNSQGVFVLGGRDPNQVFLVQISHDGTRQLTKSYGSSTDMSVRTIGGDDNYFYIAYVCGTQGSTLGDYSYPMCVTQIDSSGNIGWGLRFTAIRDFNIQYIVPYDGLVYLLGYGDSFTSIDNNDIFLLAINDDGTMPDYVSLGLLHEVYTDFTEITAFVPTETDVSLTGSASTLSPGSLFWIFEPWGYTLVINETCPAASGNNIWALIGDGFKEISVVDGFLAPMWDSDSNRLFTITSDGSTFSAEKDGKYLSCVRTRCKMSDSSDSYALETLSNDGQFTYALLKKGKRYISFQHGKFFLDNKKKGAAVFKF